MHRRKRSAKGSGTSASTSSLSEEHYWDCSVCTFRNNAEAFKCSMCDVRKGTSTRKPRLNPDLVAAQQQAQALTPPPAAGSSGGTSAGPSSSGVKSPASAEEDEEMGGDEEEDEENENLAALASLKANKRLSKEKAIKDKDKKKESKKQVNK